MSTAVANSSAMAQTQRAPTVRISTKVEYSDAPTQRHPIPSSSKPSEESSIPSEPHRSNPAYKPTVFSTQPSHGKEASGNASNVSASRPVAVRATHISHKPQMDRQEFRGLAQHPSSDFSSAVDHGHDKIMRAAPGSLPISDSFAHGFSLSVVPASVETIPWDYKSRSFSEKYPFSLPRTVQDTIWRRKPHPSLAHPYKQSRPELGTAVLATYRTQYPSDSNSLDREYVGESRALPSRERALPAAVTAVVSAASPDAYARSTSSAPLPVVDAAVTDSVVVTEAEAEGDVPHLFHARAMPAHAQEELAQHSRAQSAIATGRAWQAGRTSSAVSRRQHTPQPATQRLFALAGVPEDFQSLRNSTVRVPHPVDYNRAEKRPVPRPTIVSVVQENPHALTSTLSRNCTATTRGTLGDCFSSSGALDSRNSHVGGNCGAASAHEDVAEVDSMPVLPPIGAKGNLSSRNACSIVKATAAHPMYKATSEDYGARFHDDMAKHYVYFPRTHNFSNSLRAMK